MFRFAISPVLITSWQESISQCEDIFQASGQLYTLTYTRRWKLSRTSNNSLNTQVIISELNLLIDRFQHPELTVRQIQFIDNIVYICPLWLPDGALFGALVFQTPNENKALQSL